MKTPGNEVPYGNHFFAGINFHGFFDFWLIWQKLVPAKIAKLGKFNPSKNFKFLTHDAQSTYDTLT